MSSQRLLVVTGGRDYADDLVVRRWIRLAQPDIVYHGACRTGADALAWAACRRLGITVLPFPADWTRHGLSAGPIRNREMIRAAVKESSNVLVLAFPGGDGTAGCVGIAMSYGLRVCGPEHGPGRWAR